MSEGKRPGGLTALAVLNFIFGGINLLAALAMVALMAFLGAAVKSGDNPEAAQAHNEMAKAWEQIGLGVFYAMLALTAVSAILLLASGVGYLKQKKFLGRTLGNAYAILAVVTSLVTGLVVTAEAGGGFNIGTIIGLIYPVLTLALLNGTFKDDFIH